MKYEELNQFLEVCLSFELNGKAIMMSNLFLGLYVIFSSYTLSPLPLNSLLHPFFSHF